MESEISAIVAGITKPKTAAEAVELVAKIELKILLWAISDLPAAEQKAIVAAQWAAPAEAAESCCLPKRKKSWKPEPVFLGVH